MAIFDVNWSPSDRQVRQFGVISALALPLVAWFWGAGTNSISVVAAIGLAIAAISWFIPKLIRPLYLALSLATIPIGIVVGELVLLITYSLVFAPLGLLFRLCNWNQINRAIDTNVDTYWQAKSQPKHVRSYFRQS